MDCTSYLAAPRVRSDDVEPDFCTGLRDRFVRECLLSAARGAAALEGPGCPMAILGLLDAPLCRESIKRALCSRNLPAPPCEGAPPPSGLSPNPTGNLEFTIRQEANAELTLGGGVVGVAVDGAGVFMTNVAGQGTLGAFRGKTAPGVHSLEVYVAVHKHESFKHFGMVQNQCFTLSPNAPLHVTVLLYNSQIPPEIGPPVAARVLVE